MRMIEVKRKMITALGFCLAAGMLAGCGEAENKNNESSVLSDNFQELSEEPEVPVGSDAEDWIVQMPVSELTGDEEASSVKVKKDGSVYSRPDTQSTTCGYLTEDQTVTALSLVEGGDWCKISYNGRVAYVLANMLEKTRDLAVTETVQQSTTTITRPSNTTGNRPSGSTGSNTTTGNTGGGNTSTGNTGGGNANTGNAGGENTGTNTGDSSSTGNQGDTGGTVTDPGTDQPTGGDNTAGGDGSGGNQSGDSTDENTSDGTGTGGESAGEDPTGTDDPTGLSVNATE